VSKECSGEKCGMCWSQERKLTPATNKVQEVIFDDDPNKGRKALTQFLCARHFRGLFGSQKTV